MTVFTEKDIGKTVEWKGLIGEIVGMDYRLDYPMKVKFWEDIYISSFPNIVSNMIIINDEESDE